MVMAKKKLKKQSSIQKVISWTKSHKVKAFLLLLLLFLIGNFGYNKYLDQQNIQDMKRLLADFEQLEVDLEQATGEEFYIEADCSSIGKFAESYGCNLYLKNDTNTLFGYEDFLNEGSTITAGENNCHTINSKDAAYENFYACSISVRNPVRTNAEDIFKEYDTSPGLP
jgi:hypothetical protein